MMRTLSWTLIFVCITWATALSGEPPTRLELLRGLDGTRTTPKASTRKVYPWEADVARWAEHFGLEPAVVMGVIHAESYYRERAVSSVGARGLMQLKPKTAADYGVHKEELFVPERNIYAGCAHLRWLLDHYRGDLTRALAAYNFGHRRVSRDQGFVKRASVRRYVRKILRARLMWRGRVLVRMPSSQLTGVTP